MKFGFGCDVGIVIKIECIFELWVLKCLIVIVD